MKIRKSLFILILTGALTLSFLSPAFSQVKPGKNILASGMIELVSHDRKLKTDTIMINERVISIPPDTKIVDEWGNPLTIRDLKPGLTVVVQGIRNSGGSYERKIIVKKRKGWEQK
jgi:hypothetical protein